MSNCISPTPVIQLALDALPPVVEVKNCIGSENAESVYLDSADQFADAPCAAKTT